MTATARRSDVTIVLVLRGALVRADFAGSSHAPLAVQRLTRPLEGTLAELVEAAAGGDPLGRAVLVLSDDIFSHEVTLPGAASRDLAGDALAQALGYEAQLLSGLTAADAILAHRDGPPGGRDRRFWVSQMPREERDRVDDAVLRLGGRLAGVCHPAALPRRLEPGASASGGWRRVEHWHDVVATVEASAQGDVTARVVRSQRGRVEAPPSGATETLEASAGLAPPGEGTDAPWSLENDDVLGAWLAGWASVLASKHGLLPAIPPVDRPVPIGRRVVAAGVFLLAIAGACGLHFATTRSTREALARDLFRVREPAARLARLEGEGAALEKEARELRASTAAIASANRFPAQLLNALARHGADGLVVEGIEIGWGRSSVRGVAVDAALIDRLAGNVGRQLAPERRRVATAMKRWRPDGRNAGLYEFELEVTPARGPDAAAERARADR